jgi:hypothetical protein
MEGERRRAMDKCKERMNAQKKKKKKKPSSAFACPKEGTLIFWKLQV